MGATDLVKQGWSIAEIQAQGGWRTLKALQKYLHIQGEHLVRNLKRKGVNYVRNFMLATWQYYLVGWIYLYYHLVFLLISL
jgi:hypothetical protein